MIKSKCSNCGFENLFKNKFAERKYKCPNCGNIIQIEKKHPKTFIKYLLIFFFLFLLALGIVYDKEIFNIFIHEKDEVYVPYLKKNNKYILVKENNLMPVNLSEFDEIKIGKDPISNIIYYSTRYEDKYGLINNLGIEVIKPIYDNEIRFYNSISDVQFKLEDHFLINIKDYKKITNQKFEQVGNFYGSPIIVVNKDSKWGAINYNGTWAIKNIYDDIMQVGNKKFRVKIGSKYGVIDEVGNYLIQPIYDNLTSTPFDDGYDVTKNGKSYYIDYKGLYIRNSPTSYKIGDTTWGPTSNGLIKISILKSDYSINSAFIDITSKKIIVQFGYDYLGYFKEGFARISIKNKDGFVNLHGNLTIPPSFDNTSEFSDSLCSVLIGNKFGFIDYAGNFKIPISIPVPIKYIVYPKRYQLPKFENKYCPIESSNGKFGFIDKSGKFIIEQIYDYVSSFSEFGFTQVAVKSRDKLFLVNTKGFEFVEK
jgi:hypothetical protein